MDGADHPHQRSLGDYRNQGPPWLPPSQEEALTLEQTLHLQAHNNDATIETLVRILVRDTFPGDKFMVEDIFDKIDLGPVDRRLFGPVVRRAKKLGLVKRIDYQHSRVPGHHGLLKSLWERTDKELEECSG